LFFKFVAHHESVAQFTSLGIEPWGRIGTGVVKLIASILILIPATIYLGALLAIGLITAAIGAHLTVLGISFGSNPLLFVYAVIVMLSSLILAFFEKEKILLLFKRMQVKV
jgi:hypothetical protein